MNVGYDIFVLVFDLLQIIAIVTLIFGNKFTKSKYKQIIFIVSSFAIYLITYIVGIEVLLMFRNMLVCMLCVFLVFDNKLLKSVLCGFILFWVDSFCEGMILEYLEHKLDIGGKGNEIISVVFGTLLVLILIWMFRKLTKRSIDIERNIKSSIFVCILIFYMLYLLAYPYFKTTELHTVKYLITSICCGVTIVFLGGLFIYLVNQNSELKISQRVNEEKNKLMHNYYEQLEKRDIEIRKFRHDYQNHIRGILYYVEEEKYDGLKKYVDTIQTEGSLRSAMIDVGHNYINAILSHYVSETSKSVIKLVISGDASRASIIDDYDWSTIIPNLLNNAIEATRQVEDEDKTIEISFKYIRNKIVVSVTNPIKDDVNIPDLANIKTSKKDKLNHGFGIKNIIKTVEKYNGDISCEVNDSNVNITVWMICNQIS